MRVKIPWSAETREGRFPLNEWEVDPERTALVVVDLQRGYIEPDMGVGPTLREYPEIYQYYYPRVAELVLPNVVKLIGFFRERGLEVIFTRQGFTATDGRDLPPWNWRRGQLGRPEARLFWTGSPEAELVPELAQPDDLIVEKTSSGPFATTALDQYLRNLGIENLVVAGVLSNVAVETTARDAGDRGYNVIWAEDACAAYLPEEHEGTRAGSSWWVAKLTDSTIEVLGAALDKSRDHAAPV